MKFIVLFIFSLSIITLIFSSCATTFNSPYHTIRIATNINTGKIAVNDRVYALDDGEVKLKVNRDGDPLVIGIENGDSVQYIRFPARNSFNYIYDAIATAGLSTLVERDNPRRYFYQKNIYLEQNDSGVHVRRFAPVKKGRVNLNLIFPNVNHYFLRTEEGQKRKFGFVGCSLGLDYFYRQNKYLSMQAGAAMDNEIPIPVAVEYIGVSEIPRAYAVFLNLRQNHVIGSFEAGYGIGFTRFNWHRTVKIDTLSYRTTDINTNGLGLSLAAQYRIKKDFRVGILYQPGLLTLNHGIQSGYQHFLSAELIFKFRVKKGG